MTAPRLHASGLSRLIQCPGSFQAGGPRMNGSGEQHRAQQEGEAAHWLAEQIWKVDSSHELMEPREMLGEQAPNGIVVDEIILADVLDYLTICRDLEAEALKTHTDKTKAAERTWFETRTDFDCGTENKATVAAKCDFASYNAATQTLHVLDFKYGYRAVEAGDNWQLLAYAFSWAMHNQGAPIRKVNLAIFQPRAAHPLGVHRHDNLDSREFADKWNEFRTAVARIGVDTETATGSQCRYCPALPRCGAARLASQNSVDVSLSTREIDQLDDSALALEIEALRRGKDLIEERLPALEELAIARIESGSKMPKLQVARMQGRMVWKPDADLEFLGEMTGIELHKKKPITPKQAEKMGVSGPVLGQYADIVPGRKVLHRASLDAIARGLFKDE